MLPVHIYIYTIDIHIEYDIYIYIYTYYIYISQNNHIIASQHALKRKLRFSDSASLMGGGIGDLNLTAQLRQVGRVDASSFRGTLREVHGTYEPIIAVLATHL